MVGKPESGRAKPCSMMNRMEPGQTTVFQFGGILFAWARMVCAGKRRSDHRPDEALAESAASNDIYSVVNGRPEGSRCNRQFSGCLAHPAGFADRLHVTHVFGPAEGKIPLPHRRI